MRNLDVNLTTVNLKCEKIFTVVAGICASSDTKNTEDASSSAESEDNNQSKSENHSDDNDEVYPCLSCEFVFDDLDDLIDHYGETGHNIEY